MQGKGKKRSVLTSISYTQATAIAQGHALSSIYSLRTFDIASVALKRIVPSGCVVNGVSL
jgi:hypothetical protein